MSRRLAAPARPLVLLAGAGCTAAAEEPAAPGAGHAAGRPSPFADCAAPTDRRAAPRPRPRRTGAGRSIRCPT